MKQDATPHILANFERVSAVPRGTGREAQIARWLQDWSAARRLTCRIDRTGNLVVYVPASAGREAEAPVILQGHLDMVCEKTPDSPHDFLSDPIRCVIDGEWMHADRTTLGADNGIAIALCMSLAEADGLSHPPLEMVFTVEEEIGIGGAAGLDADLLSGRTMINLDSEEEGSFIVGCAGGVTTFIDLPVDWQAMPNGEAVLRLTVSGLQGGHSGVDIHKPRGNAIQLLARALDRISEQVSIRLVSLQGGSARNAIPRDAQAVFCVPANSTNLCRQAFAASAAEARSELTRHEPGLAITLAPDPSSTTAPTVSCADSTKIAALLMALPHGVIRMSADIQGFVETSTNLAMLTLDPDGLHVVTNQRSSVNTKRDEVSRRVEAMARLAGANVRHTEGYLAWQPNLDSPLLARAVETYAASFGRTPEVKTIHAGLECGIIAGRFSEPLDMISIGPTIQNPHSPDERLHLPSVAHLWQFLVRLLASL